MATTPSTNINIPYSPFLNDLTGRPNQEWLQWLMNPSVISFSIATALPVTSGGTGLTTIPTNGQLLIGNGTGYTLNQLTQGSGIGVTNGVGLITVANTGVLSNIASSGIAVSSATGNVTISNTGVLSFSAGSTGLTPATATTGDVALAGTLGAGYGGTGLNTYAIGDLLYASGATALSRLADVATGNSLISGGITTAPSWGKIGLTTHVSGILPIANGGTNNNATPTAGAIAYGTGTTIAFTAAGTTGQVLTSATAGTPTWTTPTTGTVTAVSVVSANGLAGSSSGGATPALTLSTTVTGVVKGNGTALSAATAATDYVAPSAYASVNGLTMATARLLGRTTASTGAAEEISVTGGLTLSGGTLTGTSGTVTSVTGTAPVVSSGGTTPAISMPKATTSVDGYLSSTDWTTFNSKGSGTVTTVSVVSANGLAGTVATATTTPAITLSTTVTGLLKGNGTAISAAVSGTDYAPATSGSSILYGNGAGGFSNVTIGTGVAFSAGTLSATGSGGTVTSVTGTAPVVSSGGTTPAISMPAATTSVNGYLTSTDWTTFNSKQAALVSGTNIKTVNGTTLLGSGDLGTITYAYGGTGLTSYTAGDIIYASAANTVAKLAIGTSGQRLVVAAGLPSWATDTTVGTVTSVAALTLGTTGTDLSSTVANGTTTPVITLQVPTASASNRGALSSTDWTTFNNKGSGSVTSVGFTGGIITVATATTTPALTVAGTSGGIPYFSSASTWATSAALAAGALVQGGGAGVAPSTITTGTGVVTALGVNTGTAGAFVVNGGALGTPSSGTVTNLTGTASININGTVGATTPTTGSFTTMKASTGAAVGGATPGAGGIAFPATAVAVADVNTLDDYREGTWTATLGTDATQPTTPITLTATYTKVGRQVHVEGYFNGVDTTGATGNIIITGLPFAVGAQRPVGPIGFFGFGAVVAIGVGIGTTIYLLNAVNISAQIGVVAGVGRYLYFSLTYSA